LQDAVIASHRDPADRIMIVIEGRVSMNLPRGRQAPSPDLHLIYT
jgi:hypothetical protein